MAQLLIRGLDKKVLERLRKRAAYNKRSLQAELKFLLERAALVEPIDPQALIERIDRMLGRRHSDSTELIAEDRRQ